VNASDHTEARAVRPNCSACPFSAATPAGSIASAIGAKTALLKGARDAFVARIAGSSDAADDAHHKQQELPLDETSQSYCDQIFAWPAMQEWIAEAQREKDEIEEPEDEF
jgi:hypothetical protein